MPVWRGAVTGALSGVKKNAVIAAALAHVRAVDEFGFLAVVGYADLLAHRGFHQFRTFRAFQWDGVSSLIVAALSVSAAVFLIFEMYAPYSGVIQVSSAPLRAALAHLGQ